MSDYLNEEEQLARLREWWQRHGVALLLGVVVVVAGVVGWRWYQGHLEERVAATSELFAEYRQADGERRSTLARRIVDEGSGTAYPTFVRLVQARDAVAAGEPEEAQSLLREAVDAATGAELADLARVRLARVLFAASDSDGALAVLQDVASAGYRALTAELKGDIHLARDQRARAHQSYTAARSYLASGEERPVLEMKIADTADASET
ncbi:MAG: YfgM family protein [Pseudomonadota bacterium]